MLLTVLPEVGLMVVAFGAAFSAMMNTRFTVLLSASAYVPALTTMIRSSALKEEMAAEIVV